MPATCATYVFSNTNTINDLDIDLPFFPALFLNFHLKFNEKEKKQESFFAVELLYEL